MTTCQNKNSNKDAADCRTGTLDDFDWHASRSAQAPCDWTLNASRILALISLTLAAYTFLQPQFDQLLLSGSACFICVLFLANAAIQEWRKQQVLKNEQGFIGVPVNSPLWSLALPLALALCASNVIAYYSTDWTTQMHWNCVVVISVITSVAFILKGQVLTHPRFAGALLGASIGSSVALSCLMMCHFVFKVRHFNIYDFGLCLVLPLIVCVYHLGSLKKMLLRLDHEKTLSTFCSSVLAAMTLFTAAAAPEARSLAIAAGETMVESDSRDISDLGFNALKLADAAPEILKQLRGEHMSNGLVLAMVPTDVELFNKLYFELTGKAVPTARPVDNNATDHNLGNLTVGDLRPGLSLQESQLTGHVDAKSLTSALYWTLVFNNQAEQPEEARCSIVLPEGAVVSRATLWINGKEQEAAFDTRQKVQAAYQWIVQRKRDPLLITQTEDGLIHLQAYPVPKWGEMKVRFGITAPLDPKTTKNFKLEPPRILSANFETSGAPTNVKLESNAAISANLSGGKSTTTGPEKVVLRGQYKLDNPSQRLQFAINSNAEFKGIASRATHAESGSFIRESLRKATDTPAAVAIVMDASSLVSKHAAEIEGGLKGIPSSIKTRFFIAGRREPATAESLSNAMNVLRTQDTAVGCDDSKALEQARAFVAREKRGMVLWIHGSQSFMSQEDDAPLRKLMMRGDHRLRIFDYQIDSEEPNQLRSYLTGLDREASPEFKTLYQTNSVEADLNDFVHNSLKTDAILHVVREKTHNSGGQSTVSDFPTASRMSTLWAAEEARRLISQGETDAAGGLGSVYRIVTPVTGAVVLEREDDYQATDLNRNMYAVISDKKLSGSLRHSERSSPSSEKAASQPLAQAAPSVPMQSNDEIGVNFATGSHTHTLSGAGGGRLFQSEPTPQLQGATNGTTGPAESNSGFAGSYSEDKYASSEPVGAVVTAIPRGADSALIQGVNTKEAQRPAQMLSTSILANALQLIAIILGAWLVACGFMLKASNTSIRNRLVTGSLLLTVGVAVPKVATWLTTLF